MAKQQQLVREGMAHKTITEELVELDSYSWDYTKEKLTSGPSKGVGYRERPGWLLGRVGKELEQVELKLKNILEGGSSSSSRGREASQNRKLILGCVKEVLEQRLESDAPIDKSELRNLTKA